MSFKWLTGLTITLALIFVSCSPRFCPAPPRSSFRSNPQGAVSGSGTSETSGSAIQTGRKNGTSAQKQSADVTTEMILVDQIGYRPKAAKWFMIKNPQTGYDSAQTYIPGSSVSLMRASDNVAVQEIPLLPWQNGKVDEEFSGDQVWQGEFSNVTTPGDYYILDRENNRRSFGFEIRDDLYVAVLNASVKSYFYQRSNIEISSKYGGKWTHALDHSQQQEAHLYDRSMGGDQGRKTALDISGGWFDAGDYGKYSSWMAPVIWDLAYAYEWYPSSFDDNTEIPESGNGVPDILDEIKIELDWLLKMQRSDGALYSGCFIVENIKSKAGDVQGDPSKDENPYFYANISTAATASGTAAFAIGARVFEAFESVYPGYAAKLETAAISGWTFLEAHPKNITYEYSGFASADANQKENGDLSLRVLAAAELFRLTSKKEFQKYFERYYNSPITSENGHQPILQNMFDPGSSRQIQRALVSYYLSKKATPKVVKAIKTALRNGVEWSVISNADQCPYKSFMYAGHYGWGSNAAKADWGNLLQLAVVLDVNPSQSKTYSRLAEEYLHYFHGRNPTGYCYLTQSQLFGADKPITQIYHTWFYDGTPYDKNPAPGFLSGGPNGTFVSSPGSNNILSQKQPPMKSYLDWNASWPENSWEITENSTSYQSRHVLLTAAFAVKK